MRTIWECGIRNAEIKNIKSKPSMFQLVIRNPCPTIFGRRAKSQICNGFTLLEVLVALAIIGLTLTVLIHSQILSLRQGMKSKYHTTALFLANEILSNTFMQEEPLLKIEGENFEDYPEFSWEREVENSDIEGLNTIKITISGPENTRIVLNTYRFQQNVLQTKTGR